MNKKLINYNRKNIVRVLYPLQKKIKKKNEKKMEFVPGSGSADPDPHQNEVDPKH